MFASAILPTRELSRGERAADGLIHLVGLLSAIVGVIALLATIIANGKPVALVTAAIYAIGLVAMLAFSTAYNLAWNSRHRHLLRRLDQAAIFIMIAGTYTPFTVLGLDGVWEVSLTSFVWTVAFVGFVLKLLLPKSLEGWSLGIYLVLGWAGVAAMGPLVEALDTRVLVLLTVGGLLYSIGTIFHVWRRLPYQNAIWHGFVVAAASVHYSAVLAVISDLT